MTVQVAVSCILLVVSFASVAGIQARLKENISALTLPICSYRNRAASPRSMLTAPLAEKYGAIMCA